jgi:uncharacterized protein YprB with RNaseH-like and TPR domain
MSRSSDLLSRLESLNRGKLRDTVATGSLIDDLKRKRRKTEDENSAKKDASAPALLYRRDLPTVKRSSSRGSSPIDEMPFVNLEASLPGTTIEAGPFGLAYLIETRNFGIIAQEMLAEDFASQVADDASPLRQRLAAREIVRADLSPHDIMIVDVESTGLGSAQLFLIGTLLWHEESLVVRQYLARTYAEEAAVIHLFVQSIRDKKLVISFNGKSFDLPFIRMRAAASAVPFSVRADHWDLLHECRRIYKGKMPNCRLQTLELHVCGRARSDDIPSADIPRAYHDYVRTNNAAEMVSIISHNMQDMVTLVDLMTRFPGLG